MKAESETNWERLDAMTDEDIAAAVAMDPDAAPILTDEQLQRFRPMSEVHPEIVEAYRRSRGLQKEPTKVPVSIRLDPEIVTYFRSQGQGWQTRINEILVEYITEEERSKA